MRQENLGLFSSIEIEDATITVFPNPSTGDFTVSNGSLDNLSVSLVDITGNIVLEFDVFSKSSEQVTTTLHSGAYLYRVYKENGDLVSVSKLIIIE